MIEEGEEGEEDDLAFEGGASPGGLAPQKEGSTCARGRTHARVVLLFCSMMTSRPGEQPTPFETPCMIANTQVVTYTLNYT